MSYAMTHNTPDCGISTQDCGIQNEDPFVTLVRTYIYSKFKPMRFGAGKLASAAGVSVRTAEGWLSGRGIPGRSALMEVCSDPDYEDLEIRLRAACAIRREQKIAARAKIAARI